MGECSAHHAAVHKPWYHPVREPFRQRFDHLNRNRPPTSLGSELPALPVRVVRPRGLLGLGLLLGFGVGQEPEGGWCSSPTDWKVYRKTSESRRPWGDQASGSSLVHLDPLGFGIAFSSPTWLKGIGGTIPELQDASAGLCMSHISTDVEYK